MRWVPKRLRLARSSCVAARASDNQPQAVRSSSSASRFSGWLGSSFVWAYGNSLPRSSARLYSRRSRYCRARERKLISGFFLTTGFGAYLGARLGLGFFARIEQRDAERFAHPVLDFKGDFRMLAQVFARVILALADLVTLVCIPGAGFFQQFVLHAQFDDLAFARDALAVQNIEECFAERRRDLVLHHLDTRLVADHFVAFLDRADAADIEAHRRVKLERVAAGGGFGVAEHHADFHADLVDENHHRVGTVDVAGQLAQRLRHQARMQAHLRIAHLAFDFRLGGQRGNRVDHHHVHRGGTHQHVGDFQRLFAVVRLRNQQVFDLHAELLRVLRIERVFRVDERRRTTQLLHFGDNLQRQRGLAGGFRAVDFNHTTARQAAHAERDVQAQRAGGYDLNIARHVMFAEAHDRTLAKLLLDLAQSRRECLAFIVIHYDPL